MTSPAAHQIEHSLAEIERKLVEREKRARRRTRLAVLIPAFIGMTLAGSLAWQATSQREVAIREASEAEVAASAAEEQRAEAERQRGLFEQQLRLREIAAPVVALGPDKSRMFSAAGWLLDATTGEPIAQLAKDAPSTARFSPDGAMLFVAASQLVGTEADAANFNAASGALVAPLVGHEAPVSFATFSPDGRHIATASLDRTVRLWDVQSGYLLVVFEGLELPPNFVAFSPDGRLLLTSHSSKAIVWEPATGQLIAEFKELGGNVRLAAFSPDGTEIALGLDTGVVTIWDLATEENLGNFVGYTP